MKTKTKTINPTNGISYFLTTYNLSYEKLAVKINSAVHDLDNNYGKITPRMVKEWAHGTLPLHVGQPDNLCKWSLGVWR